MSTVNLPDCPLCTGLGGTLLWQGPDCRVVLADEPDYPGFCRVIWQAHVQEMTDLPAPDQIRLMRIVLAVEAMLRRVLRPDKINLASFGNVVPHLHWHIIPRWRDDPHFPEPFWGARQRAASSLAGRALDAAALREHCAAALADFATCP